MKQINPPTFLVFSTTIGFFALLALLFDKLKDDVVLRAQVFNKASEIIINTIQGTQDTDCAPAQAPSTQTPAKKQSV